MQQIKPGTVVRVTDGTPRPPSRFAKKEREWLNRNYLGVLIRPDPYQAGRYDVREILAPRVSGGLQVTRSGVAAERIVLFAGSEPACRVESDGFEPVANREDFERVCFEYQLLIGSIKEQPLTTP